MVATRESGPIVQHLPSAPRSQDAEGARLLAGWGGSLAELVDAALAQGSRSLAEACIGLEAGHGCVSRGWTIETSVQPWREGASLADVLGDDVQWSFDVVESNRPAGELAQLLASVGARLL